MGEEGRPAADTTSANNAFHLVYGGQIDEVGLHVPLPAYGSEEGKGDDGLNTNLARRLILAFAAASLSFLSILTFFGPESQMASSLSFVKVNQFPHSQSRTRPPSCEVHCHSKSRRP